MIITHTSPDWDAIASVWLLQRYGGLGGHEVVFVNTANPDPAQLASAVAVTDTGRTFDPMRLRFDHHHFAGKQANETCATMQVYKQLLATTAPASQTYAALMAIDDLVFLVFNGDTGGNEWGANYSRTVGMHALLSAQKAKRLNDQALLDFGYGILDLISANLSARAEARRTLAQFQVYVSDDGLVRGLSGAPQGATFAAFEAGARLVVFHSETPESIAVGLMRGGEGADVHAGEFVQAVIESRWSDDDPLAAELRSWYRHEAGFFAGRGTAKAPDPRPLSVAVADIAAAIDGVWQR